MTAGLGDPVSDTELAARFQRDPEMFTVVYDRYIRDIFRYVGSRLGAQAADDVAAETFLVAFGQRDRFDPSRGSLQGHHHHRGSQLDEPASPDRPALPWMSTADVTRLHLTRCEVLPFSHGFRASRR